MSRLTHILATGTAPQERNMARNLAQAIGIAIAGGDFPEGSKMPHEPDLAERFSVSRTVVREAIRHLVAKGMIDVKPRAGTRVLPKDSWNLLDEDVVMWTFQAGVSTGDYAELNEVRCVFEPAAAEIAARRASPQAKARISEAYSKMAATAENPQEFVYADAMFHMEILQACENRYLSNLRNVLFAGLLSSIHKTNTNVELNNLSLPLHKSVEMAIVAGDTAAARHAMLALLQDASDRYHQTNVNASLNSD